MKDRSTNRWDQNPVYQECGQANLSPTTWDDLCLVVNQTWPIQVSWTVKQQSCTLFGTNLGARFMPARNGEVLKTSMCVEQFVFIGPDRESIESTTAWRADMQVSSTSSPIYDYITTKNQAGWCEITQM